VVLLVAGLLGFARTGAAYSVPTSITFSGYLVDNYGVPVTTSSSSPLAMKFGLYVNNTRVWYAAYTTVNVIGGSFTVHLGADDNVAQGLNPTTGATLSSTGVTPITPDLVASVTDQTPVAVQIEIANGEGYETLSPQVPIASSLFAIRSETVGGFDATQLAKQDGNGNILDANGDAIISSTGEWLGTGGGPPGQQGIQGPQGNAGPQGQGYTEDGLWNSEGEYGPYDVVTYNGSVYVTTNGITEFGTPPNQDTADWQLFAQGFNPTGAFIPGNTYYLGDVAYFNSSSYVCISPSPVVSGSTPVGDSNFTLFAAGSPGAQGATGPAGAQGPAGPPTFAGARWVATNMHAKTLTAFGGEPLKHVGTASASPQPDAFYVRWVSAGAAKKTAGEVGPFRQTESRYQPIYSALIRTGSSIAEQRIWVALTSADLSQSDGVGALATRYIGVRYSTSANDKDWQVGSGDGTTGSVQDSGIAVQANTYYLIELTWSTNGELNCQINGVSCATKTTNLDTGKPTELGVDCVTTALSSTPVVQSTAYISLQYNGNNF
jgi:hypothetical protein